MRNILFEGIDLSQQIGMPLTIKCLEEGRWILDKNLNLVDTKLHVLYKRPVGVDAQKVVFENVTDLTEEPISLIFLFTLAMKPLYSISKANLMDPVTQLKVTVSNGAFTAKNGAQVHWHFPENGVRYEGLAGAYAHVPGATDIIVSETGIVRSISENKEIIPGSNRGGLIQIITDLGEEIEASVAELVLAAYGHYRYDNLDKNPIFLDNDNSNFALANLSVDLVTNEVSGREATSNEELRVTTPIIID